MNSFIDIYAYCLVLFSFIIIMLTIYKLWCSYSATNWQKVSVDLLELKIVVKDFLFFKIYKPKAKYSLVQKGHLIVKNDLTISSLSFYDKSKIDEIYQKHHLAAGHKATAYQNPIFKSSYILVPGLEKKSMLIVPILFFLFSLGSLLYNIRWVNGFSKPYTAQELYDQSYDLMEKGRYESSYQVLKQCQSLNDSLIESYYLGLELADHLPHPAQIKLTSYDHILKIDSSKSDVMYNRGSLLYDEEKYQLAIKDFRQYLKKKQDPDGAYNLALCYVKLGSIDSAKAVLQSYKNYKDCQTLLETLDE